VRIYDDAGNPAPPGTDGLVYVKPPTSWPAFTYLGDASKRASIERDGHVTIGDVGHLDGDGFLHLTGRASDMVISGGVNIYPAEIENCMLGLAGVRDVAVFGIPHDDYGEALAAHVDADPGAGLTAENIRAHVRCRLAPYKTPTTIVFDNQLPREDSGKIFKRLLQQRYSAARR
jgi:long-chain acyl-CoA synthetase